MIQAFFVKYIDKKNYKHVIDVKVGFARAKFKHRKIDYMARIKKALKRCEEKVLLYYKWHKKKVSPPKIMNGNFVI